MSPQDLLGKLPSIEELLEHPRVRDASDRWNRSATAARVRSALSSFTAEASKRAESLAGLSPSDLLDRFVRGLDQPTSPAQPGVVNATGSFGGPGGAAPPLPNAAVEALCAVAGSPPLDGSPSPTAGALRRVVGAEGGAPYASHAGAVGLALAALSGGAPCVVARREVGDLGRGVRLNDLAASLGVALLDVGDSQGATPDDYHQALERLRRDGAERPLVYHRPGPSPGGPAGPDTAAIAEGVHRAGGLLVVDLQEAAPRSDTPLYGAEGASAEEALAAGADLVALRGGGGGLLGGPCCGLLMGRGDLIESVGASPAARALRAGALVDAAVAATLELFATPRRLHFAHPLFELLDTPLENLRTRAERLAAQIAPAEGVAEAQPIEIATDPARGVTGGQPSWGVLVRPAAETAEPLARRIAEAAPPVLARLQPEGLLLDLRTLFPRQQSAVLRAFGADPGAVAEGAGPSDA